MPPDVDEGADEVGVPLRLEDLEEGGVGAEGIPESKDIVVVGLGGVPAWVLAGAVRGDQEHAVY